MEEVGFPTEFCSERVSGNKDETNFVMTQNKVVIPGNSGLSGMAYFVLQNGRKPNEITRNSRSLRNKRTMLNFFSFFSRRNAAKGAFFFPIN